MASQLSLRQRSIALFFKVKLFLIYTRERKFICTLSCPLLLHPPKQEVTSGPGMDWTKQAESDKVLGSVFKKEPTFTKMARCVIV